MLHSRCYDFKRFGKNIWFSELYGTVLTVGRQNYLILVSEKFCHFRHLVRLYFDIIHTTYVKYRLSYPYQIMYVGKICSIFSENRRRPSLLKTNC
jgi:CDP-diglyceride synthetase